jgi:D-proline reductase (dithiol) PrdB
MADERPAVKPLEMSRYCVPFTPFRGRVEEAIVCLVSTAGVRRASDPPFQAEGDVTYRVIPGEASGADLVFDGSNYDHACAELDINCIFPIDRLRELARERRIGGLTDRHFSMGFSQALRELAETTIPTLAREVDRERPDAVLLTGGCRLCHRVVVTLQRAVEMLGIPTVVITVEPEETAQARPPRALRPRGFAAGYSLGRAGDPALQKRILSDALGLLTSPARPGEVIERDYQ